MNKEQFYEQLDFLRAKIKNYYKCDSVDEIDSTVSSIEAFINQYDIMK